MTQNELEQIASLLKQSQQSPPPFDLTRWLLPVLIGCSIAFVGWFANKSSRDIENTATINKTLEFMQLQQATTNEALKVQITDVKASVEVVKEKVEEKLSAPRFTREDFNREMLYRDQDINRMQNQFEEIIDKLNNQKP